MKLKVLAEIASGRSLFPAISKGGSRVAFVFGKAFQMTSQNASLREREQVSLRRSVGVTATGSRCNYFKATERAIERGASHRIMLLQWSWGFANLQSFPRGHTSSLLGPSFLPSFDMLPPIIVASRYPLPIYLGNATREPQRGSSLGATVGGINARGDLSPPWLYHRAINRIIDTRWSGRARAR